MDLITIISVLIQWGALAAVGGILLGVVMIAGYLFYQKVLHGKKTVTKKQALVFFLLVCWLLVVLGLTTFSRGANYTGKVNAALFSGYVSAWNNWSLVELQLILFNMLMFFPLGFLLPLLWKKAEKPLITAAISLGITGAIELTQLVTGKGIFELDDLFNNFIGSMFGYFCIMAVLRCIRERRFMVRAVLPVLIVPCMVGAAIGGAVLVYEMQPYGNMLSITPAIKQNMTRVTIHLDTALSEKEDTASVFRNIHANQKDWMANICKQLAELEDITFSGARVDGSNGVFPGQYRDGTDVQFTATARSGSWSLDNWNEYAPLNEADAETLRNKYEDWLHQNDLLPEEAIFSFQNGDTLYWGCTEPEGLSQKQEDFCDGAALIQFDSDQKIASFFYAIQWNQFVKTEEIISEKDAYEEILDGNFELYNPLQSGDVLYIEDVSLSYAYDTKGFYQPIYVFTGYINEPDNLLYCSIAARK